MTTLKRLHDGGQSIWLDAISRDMLRDGTLAHYIRDFSVTGLTSNPTIFQRFVASTNRYDDEIRKRLEQGVSAERLFFEFALGISSTRPTCCDRSSMRRAASMGSPRSRSRPPWRTTRRGRSPRAVPCSREPTGPTC